MRYFRYKGEKPFIIKTNDEFTEYYIMGIHTTDKFLPIDKEVMVGIRVQWKELTEEEAFLDLI